MPGILSPLSWPRPDLRRREDLRFSLGALLQRPTPFGAPVVYRRRRGFRLDRLVVSSRVFVSPQPVPFHVFIRPILCCLIGEDYSMPEIMLHGCTPEPLMSYLKALGVLRL